MSNNLDLDQLAEAQASPEVTVNNATLRLGEALTESFNVDVSGGNATVTSTQYRTNIRFDVTGGAAARDVTFPAVQRAVIVSVDGGCSNDITLKVGSTSVKVAPGETVLMVTDGTTDGMEVLGAINPMDIGVFIPGLPVDGAVVLRYTPTRPMTIPDNALGSVCNCEVDPASDATFTIKKNGSDIGTILISAAATTGTFTFSSPVSFNGTTDVLEIIAPSPDDADLANVFIGIKGYR